MTQKVTMTPIITPTRLPLRSISIATLSSPFVKPILGLTPALPNRQPAAGQHRAKGRGRAWLCCVIAFTWLLVAQGAAYAQADWPTNLIEPPDATAPTTVAMSLYLDDVSRIDVATHTYEVTGQLVMEWHDDRLLSLFALDDARTVLEFEGSAVATALSKLWHPAVEIMNERGQRHTGVRGLDIYADGRVKLYEKFDSLAHLEGDMHFFPFVQADLRLAFSAFAQNQAELLLHIQRYEFEHGASADEVIVGPWNFVAMTIEDTVTQRSDEPDLLFSRADFVLTVQRSSLSGLSIYLLPILLIWVCSFSLLWLDIAEVNPFVASRIGGTLTLLLTTVAFQLTLEARLPSVHYLTLTSLLVYLTILLLALSISFSVAYLNYFRQAKEPARAFNRTVRWALPAFALLVTLCIMLVLFL